MRGGYAIATDPVYRQCVKDNTPIDCKAFQTTFLHWATHLNDLRREIHMGVATNVTSRWPTFAYHFPSLKLLNGGEEPAQKKQKLPNGSAQPVVAARNDPRPPNQDRAQANDRKHVSPEEQAKLKQRGFLKWSNPRMPSNRVAFTNDKGKQELLCWGFACQNLFCRFGTDCRRHHVVKYSDLPKDAQQQLAKEVSITDGLSFAPGQGPPGKA